MINHLRRDKQLSRVLDRITLTKIVPSTDYFSDLCETIINQQLSEKAGATIWSRFKKLFVKLTPDKVLATADEKIRTSGISRSKISYLKNLARYAKNLDILRDMKNDEVIDELTKVKGIGRWTAEMFLMFSLGREDVFSQGDAGLQRAIANLYGKKHMDKIIAKWSPYKTYACRVLWKSLGQPNVNAWTGFSSRNTFAAFVNANYY